jgi:hypothetical protein
MSVLDEISKSLSNFPRDIIIQWVAYYAETEGWPPPNPLSGRWKSLLGDRGLEYWKSLSWNLEKFYPSSFELVDGSSKIIQDIVGFHALNEENDYSRFMGEEAVHKLHQIIQYLRENGDLPCAPILIDHKGKYEILDGYHRVTAYLLCEQWKDTKTFQKEPFPVELDTEIEFWVGRSNA